MHHFLRICTKREERNGNATRKTAGANVEWVVVMIGFYATYFIDRLLIDNSDYCVLAYRMMCYVNIGASKFTSVTDFARTCSVGSTT